MTTDSSLVVAANKELAKAYFQCVAPYASSWGSYSRIKNLIETARFDITKHYHSHDNLRDCELVGVGRKSMLILEQILRDGSETAAARYAEHEARELRQRALTGSDKRRRAGGHGYSGGDGFVDL